MADGPAFGRRNSPAARSAPAFGKAGESAGRSDPPPVPPRDTVSEQLESRGARALLVGELVGFAGLLIVFAAGVLWPADPAGLDVLKGLVYLPDVLRDAIPFTDPKAWSRQVYAHVSEVRANNLGVPLIFFLGLAAVVRRRWLLAGLCAGFFLLPPQLFGLAFPAGFPMAILLGIAAALRQVRLEGRARIAFIAAATMLMPVLLVMFLSIVPSRQGGEKAPYLTIRFSELAENSDGQGVRGTTVDAIVARGAEQAGAKAFALSQEQALRGETQAAMASLARAQAAGFPHNRFERRIVEAIRDYSIASGGEGEAAGTAIMERFRTRLIGTWILLLAGLIVGLAAPFGDIIATVIRRRVGRIEAAKAKLGSERPPAGEAAIPHGGSAGGASGSLTSIAAADAEQIVGAMSKRIRFYQVGAMFLGWIVLYCLGRFWVFHLPPADSNTAFDTVGLSGWTVFLGDALGVGNLHGQNGSGLVGFPMDPLSLLTVVPYALLFVRQYRVVGLCALVVTTFLHSYRFDAPLREPANPVLAQQIDTGFREALERVALSGSDRGGEEKVGVVLSDKTGQPVEFSIPVRVDASNANYVLAQIAYLEDRPEDAAHYLGRDIDAGSLDGLIHRQRLDLMREWVSAHGYGVPSKVANLELRRPMSFARRSGNAYLAAAVAAGLLLIVLSALLTVAGRRRGRIVELVEMRRQSRSPVEAMVPIR